MVAGRAARERVTRFFGALAGFTLIELIVVVAVVAVVAAVAVPSFTQMVANSRIGGAANTLQAALLKARSEALKRNCSVTVRRTGSSWSQGWEVIALNVDSGGDCSGAEYDTDPGLSLQVDAPRGVVVTGSSASVTYSRSGRTTGSPTFEITRDPPGAGQTRCLLIELDGYPKVVKAECA
ncbi:MAG: GspH/FimT family pseudopilin [Pseudomonadota bacterium]|jgi:type IV fimbrial biogenesis protein FimT